METEAERKACEDEGNEIVKRNQQRLNGLKQEGTCIRKPLLIQCIFDETAR